MITLASKKAWERFRALERRALFVSDWLRAIFIHFEVDPALQLESEGQVEV